MIDARHEEAKRTVARIVFSCGFDYDIKWSKADRAELVARSRCYTPRYRDVIRAKIVLLASEGRSLPRHDSFPQPRKALSGPRHLGTKYVNVFMKLRTK